MDKQNDVLLALTHRSDDLSFRFQLYRNIMEDVLNRIFFEKNAGVDFWYFIYAVPVKCERDIEDYRHYSQTECCRYISTWLREKGFYAKTMNGETTLFVSWHEKHLKQVQEEKAKASTKQKVDPTRLSPWRFTTSKAKIQLQGGKSNIQDNRRRLANFFLMQSK